MSGVTFCIAVGIVLIAALCTTVYLDISVAREEQRKKDERLKEVIRTHTTTLKEFDEKLGNIVETLQSLPPDNIIDR
ncbi:TPA: hypothetical protein DDX46_01470 [Candidatus Saccharibacteria bacterium]|nr:MAG: hypothetical protein UW38_C0001G0111 [Candidatus Saccharibacteria bacterium GW2011_GWC2_44_17]OGL33055.1 MAG: hypothetical protein A3E20_00925 [Candidatus Saccharibacteria bacterium RIFCSPHIGHO2_12_FULL_47_16]HBH77398.1 hypothetical protein [Candidatus Saccharibacteria bacterium]